MGITRLADVTGLDRLGIPVFQSTRPASRNLSVSQGKGLTPAAARVSAAMESVEMWHAEDLAHLPQLSMPVREMAYSNPIRADQLRWMGVAETFDALPITWIEARSLTGGRSGWLPRSMMELDFAQPDLFEPQMFVRNSNGLASGNTSQEALLHGLCEVVERHSWCLMRDSAHPAQALDLSSLNKPCLAELVDAIRRAGMKLAVYDTTCEIGLPAVMAKLAAEDLPVVWHGFGCHTSREIAVSRALTEAAQSRLAYIAGARDDLVGMVRYAPPHREFDAFAEPAGEVGYEELPDLATRSLADDLQRVIARLADLAYEPYWIDLTLPEIGIPVVIIFVPGLLEIDG